MKNRADLLLFELGFAKSRTKAKDMILKGKVTIDGEPVTKPSQMIDGSGIQVENYAHYVSRGAYKLLKAMEVFSLQFQGKTAMDIGASTGGFTDLMLKHGIDWVYCIDVGTNQLAVSIKNNPKVVVMEKTNFRYMEPNRIDRSIDLITIDVSFISLTYILPKAFQFMPEHGEMIALVKPQYEVGKRLSKTSGLVKDPSKHLQVLSKIHEFIHQSGFMICHLTHSPIKGGSGNIEYLIYIKKKKMGDMPLLKADQIEQLVSLAFQDLF